MEEAPLPRCFSLAVPRIVVGEQASLNRPDFNRRLLSNVDKKITLNPPLLQSIYLLTVHRRALVDMHSRSSRVRVRSEYRSGGVVFPFDMPMMDRMCAQLMNNMYKG
jgi:hypothetical protein